MPQETPIDVPKAAIERLLRTGLTHAYTSEKEGLASARTYWDGYCRALEHVLEMESE